MSPFDVRLEQSSRPGFTMVKPGPRQRTERASALIVMVLTLACTALCILDLFLLASGF